MCDALTPLSLPLLDWVFAESTLTYGAASVSLRLGEVGIRYLDHRLDSIKSIKEGEGEFAAMVLERGMVRLKRMRDRVRNGLETEASEHLVEP